MGDLSLREIGWCYDLPKASRALERSLLEIVAASNMSQLVLHRTRKSNILNIILTTALPLIGNVVLSHQYQLSITAQSSSQSLRRLE